MSEQNDVTSLSSPYAPWPGTVNTIQYPAPEPLDGVLSYVRRNIAMDVVPFDELPLKDLRPINPSKRYACPQCSKEFYSKNDFRRHYMIHSGEKPYACKHCDYKFQRYEKLKLHLSTSHDS